MPKVGFDQRVKEMTRDAMVAALIKEEGNVSAAARRLDMPRRTFWDRMRIFEIDPDQYRPKEKPHGSPRMARDEQRRR